MTRVSPVKTPSLDYNKSDEFQFRKGVELSLQSVSDGIESSQHLSDIASSLSSKRTVVGMIPTGIVTYGPGYTVSNPTTDRALDVTGDTLPQVAAVLGTLIIDLRKYGILS